jgi:DNA-binding response OmpR family regulator
MAFEVPAGVFHRFRFGEPLASQKDRQRNSRVPLAVPRIANKMKNILIVDDDKDLCNLIAEIASEEGFAVSKAYDGFIALEKIRNNNYDIAVIDNRLSGLSGISMLEYIRKIKPGLKTIMISAYMNKRTRNIAKDLGVNEFVDKPFDITYLVERIKEALRSSQ